MQAAASRAGISEAMTREAVAPGVLVPRAARQPLSLDLAEYGLGRKILKSRYFQPVLILVNMAVFVVLITAGLYGNPIGNQNAAIILIWVFWFFLLIAVLVPVGGRAWCLMCPLPAPGEWLSRLAITRRGERTFPGLRRKWPASLDNIWLQNFGFLLVATLSPVILTRPWATAYLMIGMIALALVLPLVFIKQSKVGRLFCKYVCPVGGFIGLYSLMGAVEVKARDLGVCKTCKHKNCIKGNEDGWGCPWFEYPGTMQRNLYCGLCAECVKTCANDNIAFRLRPFGADLLKQRKLDEAYKAFIMLGSGLLFLAVFFGWWGGLKDIADPLHGLFPAGPVRWGNLLRYVSLLWGVALVGIPGIHLATCWLVRRAAGPQAAPLRKIFVDFAYVLVPLGLMAWLAFVLGMIMVNGSYVVSVISDPMGWGWDLFGTAEYHWRPYLPEAVPFVQLGLLLVGVVWATTVAHRLAREHAGGRRRALRAAIPMAGSLAAYAAAFVFLFVMA